MSPQDPLAQLSEDMVARGYNIFSVVLKYAVDMLTWDKEDLLPPGLDPPYARTDTDTYTQTQTHARTYARTQTQTQTH